MAAKYLISIGYKLLEKNWRYSKAEIDLILKSDEILVFCEVKARTGDHFGQPEDSISAQKENLIQDAAQRYMELINYEWEIRFDIISIMLDKQGQLRSLRHFKDAFFN